MGMGLEGWDGKRVRWSFGLDWAGCYIGDSIGIPRVVAGKTKWSFEVRLRWIWLWRDVRRCWGLGWSRRWRMDGR